jgi:PAS domain S-box-containing protein
MYKINIEELKDVNAIFVVIDKDGKVIEFNKYAQEITGYKASQVVGYDWFEIFISEEDKIELQVVFDDIINHNKKYWKHTNNIVCKDGTKKLISWNNSLIKDEQDNIQAIVSFGIDLTISQELKYKDQMLLQQSKMAAMGEMLETIAHQWRQPLSAISTVASGIKMKKEFGILEDDEFYESCDNIVEITNHLSQTIDDFRAFFKPNKEKTVFNLKHTIEKTFELIGSKFKNSDIELKFDLEDVEVHGFENELIQSFMVILNNARDAFNVQDGGKKLLFISLCESRYYAIIKIRDNAGGIKEDIIHKIFNPYFTTKHESHGTGIGLYMVDEIVSKHMQGSIKAKNVEYVYDDEEYKGAEFVIELPNIKLDSIEDKFLEQLVSCHCYRWNKEKETFKKLDNCTDKMVLQDISVLSSFLNEYNIKFEILQNQDIQVIFE